MFFHFFSFQKLDSEPRGNLSRPQQEITKNGCWFLRTGSVACRIITVNGWFLNTTWIETRGGGREGGWSTCCKRVEGAWQWRFTGSWPPAEMLLNCERVEMTTESSSRAKRYKHDELQIQTAATFDSEFYRDPSERTTYHSKHRGFLLKLSLMFE